VKRGNYSHH